MELNNEIVRLLLEEGLKDEEIEIISLIVARSNSHTNRRDIIREVTNKINSKVINNDN